MYHTLGSLPYALSFLRACFDQQRLRCATLEKNFNFQLSSSVPQAFRDKLRLFPVGSKLQLFFCVGTKLKKKHQPQKAIHDNLQIDAEVSWGQITEVAFSLLTPRSKSWHFRFSDNFLHFKHFD